MEVYTEYIQCECLDLCHDAAVFLFLYENTIIVVSGVRSLYGELWLGVFVTCREYLCENVYSCVKETLSVPDVLHSSSALTPCQTAGLIWTHTSSFSHVASLFPSYLHSPTPVSFGGGLGGLFIVHLWAFLFTFTLPCKFCLGLEYVSYKSGPSCLT